MSSVPNGLVLFEGPSALDGEPIAVIITGLHGSSNRKTGDMLQGWILRSDIDPIQATKTGQDSSVCGQCPLRGNVLDGHNRGRVCYVGLPRGPQDVYQAYRRGRYPRFDPTKHKHPLKDRKLRIGAYGDPCAAPYAVWSRLARVVADSVGYTHQWRDRRFWRFRNLCMASCETLGRCPTRSVSRVGGRSARYTMLSRSPSSMRSTARPVMRLGRGRSATAACSAMARAARCRGLRNRERVSPSSSTVPAVSSPTTRSWCQPY